MTPSHNNNFEEETDLKKISKLFGRNYGLFIVFVIISVGLAFLINRYSIADYKISSSILIVENKAQSGASAVNDYLNSSLFGKKQNFQNELWVLKSSPVLEQTIRNLDLSVTYYEKKESQYHDAYQDTPLQIAFLPGHPQPVGVRFELTFLIEGYFQI
jgi:tyrosine-protein kinase Etk/Wzc